MSWMQYKHLKLEKKGGTSKIGLYSMQMHHILEYQYMMKKTYLLQNLSMILN